jgi:hypothetical protein
MKGYMIDNETKCRLSEKPFENLMNQRFKVGDGDVIPGIELTLR